MEWFDAFDINRNFYIDVIRDYLQNEVKPVIDDFERKAEYPEKIIQEMIEMGWFGIIIPEEYGGMGLSLLDDIFFAREVSYISCGLHLARIANSTLTAYPILIGGTETQKKRHLPHIARGEKKGCFGLSEPDAGSDARAMKTCAYKKGNQWIVNGEKTWITNAMHASLMVFFAKDEKGAINAFLLDAGDTLLCDFPGVTVTKLPKHVLKVAEFCSVKFDNAVLPVSALLGEEGKGFSIAKHTLIHGRHNIAGQSIGGAAGIFDSALAYVKKREQFGSPLWDKQVVRHDFAEWYKELLAAWNLVVKSASILDKNGEPLALLSSSAKSFATEIASRIAHDAVKKFGAMIFEDKKGTPLFVTRVLDLIAAEVYEGTNPVHNDIIANELDKIYS